MHKAAHVLDARRMQNNKRCQRLRGLRAIALGATLLAVVGCGGGPYSTPEATFETFQDAQSQGNWQQVCECLTPDSRDLLAGSLVFLGAGSQFVSTAAQFDGHTLAATVGTGPLNKLKQMAKHSNEIFNKHGIGDALGDAGISMQAAPGPDEYRKLAAGLKDKNAFVADMIAAMNSVMPEARPDLGDFANASLESVEDIDGDTVHAATNSTKHPRLTFKRIDGEWKLEYDFSESVSRAIGGAM